MFNRISKKVTMILLIVGGSLLALGFIINMIVLGMNGFDINKAYGVEENTHEALIEGDVNEINIDVAEADVNIYEVNEGEVAKVVFLDSYNIYHTSSVNNGVLAINRVNKLGWLHLFVPTFFNKMSVDVYLPKVSEYNNIDIKVVSGDLKLNVALNSKNTSLSIVSGDVNINSLKGDLKIKGVSGDLFINESNGNTINLETVSGTINTSNASYEVARFKSVSGDIKLNGEVKRELNAEAVSGDIFLECKNPIVVSAKTTSGNITLPSNNIGSASANLKTVSGDITCKLI